MGSEIPRPLAALSPGPSDRPQRLRASLLGTLPGRLLVVGAGVKGFTWLLGVALGVQVRALEIVGSLGSIAFVIGLFYFTYRLIVQAKRRLLWRVRRKLILSYVFVGVVPVLLVVAFFVLSGFLLFLNVASYLVASSIRTATDDATFMAQTTASDLARSNMSDPRGVMERKQATLSHRYPSASMVLVPTGTTGSARRARPTATPAGAPSAVGAKSAKPQGLAPIAVGPWRHLSAPNDLPPWVGSSYGGLLAVTVSGSASDAGGKKGTGLVIRAAARPPDQPDAPFAVVVDIPLDSLLASRIREDTSIKLGEISSVPISGEAVQPTTMASNGSDLLRASASSTSGKRRVGWVAFLDWRDWNSGVPAMASVSIEVSIADIYERLSAAQGRMGGFNFGAVALFALALLAVLFFIIEVVALVMGLVLARSITGSVHELFTGTGRVREGDFSHKIQIKTRDQMGELADSFNQMTGSIEELLRQAEEKKRLEEELRIARSIQMSLLPRGQMSVPGVSITALCVPAREVGGDYYDLLPLDGGRLGVLIADVAGKGTSAALYMAEMKGLMLSLSRIYLSPRQLLIEANRIIADHLGSRSFITMTYAVLDVARRTMTYARAGHTPLMQRTTDGNGSAAVRTLTPDGLVVGLQMDDGGALFERLLKEETVPLRGGDLFMFFTDGISEAMNHESDCFGEARLGEILSEHGDLPSEELRERILREIDAFVAGAPQHDDMTMILLKVEGAMAGAAEPIRAQPINV